MIDRDALLPAPRRRARSTWATCSLRLLPVVALSPFLGGPLLPPVARAALALALGAAVRTATGAGEPSGAPFLAVAGLGAGAGRGAGLRGEPSRRGGPGRRPARRHAPRGHPGRAPRGPRSGSARPRSATCSRSGRWRSAPGPGPTGCSWRRCSTPSGPCRWAGRCRASLRFDVAASAAADLLAAALCLGAPAAAALLCADLALSAASRLAPRSSLLDAAPPVRAALGLVAVALPAAAIGGRLVELAALAGGRGGAGWRRGAP